MLAMNSHPAHSVSLSAWLGWQAIINKDKIKLFSINQCYENTAN